MGRIQLANKRVYTLFVENPISGDNIPRIKVPRLFRCQEITYLKLDSASGSVDVTIRFDPDASQTGGGTVLDARVGVTNNTTGLVIVPPFSGGVTDIPADNFLWMELANVTTGIFRPVSFSAQLVGVERGA